MNVELKRGEQIARYEIELPFLCLKYSFWNFKFIKLLTYGGQASDPQPTSDHPGVRDTYKIVITLQAAFSNAYPLKKIIFWFKFHLNFFRGQLELSKH